MVTSQRERKMSATRANAAKTKAVKELFEGFSKKKSLRQFSDCPALINRPLFWAIIGFCISFYWIGFSKVSIHQFREKYTLSGWSFQHAIKEQCDQETLYHQIANNSVSSFHIFSDVVLTYKNADKSCGLCVEGFQRKRERVFVGNKAVAKKKNIHKLRKVSAGGSCTSLTYDPILGL